MVVYQTFTSYSENLAGQEIQVISKPGLAHWDQLPPTISLIAEHVSLRENDRLLIMGTHCGVAASGLAHQNLLGETWLTDQSSIALECAQRTLAANNVRNGQITRKISQLPGSGGQFDVVVIESPKGRLLNRRWLVEANSLLHTGGTLYLAGSNELGIQSIARDAGELFGNTSVLDYKKGTRIIRLVKGAHRDQDPAWKLDPGIAPGTWITYSLQEGDHLLKIHTLPGVFSSAGLDAGTSLLLEKIGTPGASQILDVGCGCGVIGMVLACRLQKTNRSYSVDMVDSDLYAVASAQKNLMQNNLDNLRVFPGDLLEAVKDNKYDLIVSNPPFHTGKEVNYMITEALIQQSYHTLNRGGQLILVANQFIRYEKNLERYFRDITILAQDNRFRLISALK